MIRYIFDAFERYNIFNMFKIVQLWDFLPRRFSCIKRRDV